MRLQRYPEPTIPVLVVNVHSTLYPGGEIRGQIRVDD